MGSNTTTNSSTPPPTMKRQTSRTAMYAVVAIVVIVVIVLAGGYAAGWFKGSSSSPSSPGTCAPPAGVTIKGAGSTLVYPLMFQWESVYGGGTAVNYESVGSGAGITDITQKTVDFGASDAPLSSAQTASLPATAVTIPESAGGVVPIYNLPGVPTLNFNGTILTDIYLGQITSWNNTALQAINPGVTLPTAPISVVFRSDGSGTTFIWTSYLSAESAAWAAGPGKGTAITFPVGSGQAKNAGVAGYVQKTPDTIGYVDLNYALNGGIAFGKVQNPAGNYVLASVNNTASALKDANPTLPAGTASWYNVSVLNAKGAGDYPITSLTYMLVYQDLSGAYGSALTLTAAETLVDFLYWSVTTGQSYSAQLYYIPLPANIVAADEVSIATLMYNGAAVPNSCGSSV
ncbi:MAG: phosphate ABC transporter substrate-binding protein PstS [Thermoplasmata archaeon]|jgi:phosphate transport system substrate-binding protein|nr:phosphate ABC transporter substrate-binding protein PstS [Thermoplasmata archaeon]